MCHSSNWRLSAPVSIPDDLSQGSDLYLLNFPVVQPWFNGLGDLLAGRLQCK